MSTWTQIGIRDLMKAVGGDGEKKKKQDRATRRQWKTAIAEAQRNGGSCFRLVCNILGGERFSGAVQCKKSCKSSAMVCGWFLWGEREKEELNFFTRSSFCSIQRYYIYIYIIWHTYLYTQDHASWLQACLTHCLIGKAVTCLMTFITEFIPSASAH